MTDKQLTDQPTDWLNDGLTDYVADWLTNWLADCLIDQLAVAIGQKMRAKTDVIDENRFHNCVSPFCFQCQQKDITANHENWIEQLSKQDSYLIQRFYSHLRRYNQPANGEEREDGCICQQRYNETVMRYTSNSCLQ